MVIIRMQGGLANKMFQYAFYKSLEVKGVDVYLDDQSFKPRLEHEHIRLEDIFSKIKAKYASLSDINKLGGGQTLISRIRRKFTILKQNSVIVEGECDDFDSIISELSNSYYIIALVSSEYYFKNIESIIRKDFLFPALTDNRNLNLANELFSTESVAIHVRKGNDYNNSNLKGTCNIDYYYRAINHMKQHLQSPVFYVFTDNEDWVRRNFNDVEYILVNWNPTIGKDNYIDMQLMSYAKHNIIANSTYSWWGAWLNNNINKIVIGPAKWYSKSFYRKKGYQRFSSIYYLPSDWIKT